MAYQLFLGPSEFINSIIEPAETNVQSGNLVTSFTTSFLAILATQVGDKTFFLAMIMAMKYNKIVVFVGAFAALAIMTVLSAVSGKIIFSLLPKIYTDIAVTLLFFYFGGKLIYQAYHDQETEENQQRKQVQIELKQMEQKFIRQSQSHAESEQAKKQNRAHQIKNVMTNKIIFTQAFVMTFLAQWGDRSQIATIALAVSYNLVMVNIGAMLGHFICTGGAVNLGEWISNKVSQKCVHYVGGIVFIMSGIVTFFMIFQQQAQA